MDYEQLVEQFNLDSVAQAIEYTDNRQGGHFAPCSVRLSGNISLGDEAIESEIRDLHTHIGTKPPRAK